MISLTRKSDYYIGRFTAMACPCEVLIDADDGELAGSLVDAVEQSARRIELKFSRYRSDNAVHVINSSEGRPVAVDFETANLIDFAATLTSLSGGRFDITSGVLRRAWKFDGGHHVPCQAEIDALLRLVGWSKAEWHRPVLRLLPGMQIDFGGIGKEYAVDAAAAIADSIAPGVSCLINFGGDVAVRHGRRDGQPWRVGIETADRAGTANRVIKLTRGGLATSGDSRRFVLKDGKRYSHILDATSGWPVADAPRSISVLSDTCTQAGTLTTLAMLQGPQAESFLKTTHSKHWVERDH